MTDLKLAFGTRQTQSKAPEVGYVEPVDVVTIAVTSDSAGTRIDKIEWTKDGKSWDPVRIADVDVIGDLAKGTYRLEFTATDQFLGEYKATGAFGQKKYQMRGVTLARATQAARKKEALRALGIAVDAVRVAAGSKNPRTGALVLEIQDILTRCHVEISDSDA